MLLPVKTYFLIFDTELAGCVSGYLILQGRRERTDGAADNRDFYCTSLVLLQQVNSFFYLLCCVMEKHLLLKA